VLKQGKIAKAGALLVLALVVAVTEVSGGDNAKKEAGEEMEFGYKAARRGYWQEALMRFEHANQLTPDQARILNNIAVAQEANGQFEQALLTYQTGLAIDPRNDALKRNYARFQEFYTTYIARPDDERGADDEKGADDGKEDD
jgi:Flp pilus assembly protein TadD